MENSILVQCVKIKIFLILIYKLVYYCREIRFRQKGYTNFPGKLLRLMVHIETLLELPLRIIKHVLVV